MTRPALTKLRGIWRDQVFADHQLTPSARVVGYAIGSLITMPETAAIYSEKGRVRVWPSQRTICAMTGLSTDTVRVAVAVLIDRGHMRLARRGNQVLGSNRYRILFTEPVK